MIDHEIPTLNFEKMVELIREKMELMPVLVYCSSQFETEMQRIGLPFTKVSQVTNYQDLRNLDKKEEDQSFKLYVATSEVEMRGVDFRARNSGICLLIAKPFTTHRDAM